MNTRPNALNPLLDMWEILDGLCIAGLPCFYKHTGSILRCACSWSLHLGFGFLDHKTAVQLE